MNRQKKLAKQNTPLYKRVPTLNPVDYSDIKVPLVVISDDLMEFNGAICDEGGCFDGGRVYFDKDGVDQEGEERANWIDARWCDGMNRDGLPATWTYETEIPCERFDIWEDGEVYCVGLVFSIEDLK